MTDDRQSEKIEASVTGEPLSDAACELPTAPGEPCTLVIFGASGDLTARKLLPALFRLFIHRSLPEPFTIVGCSRTAYSRREFLDKLRNSLAAAKEINAQQWENFAANLFYRQVMYDSAQSYRDLADYLKDLDARRPTRGNRIFYLAVPPKLYPVIAEQLGAAGLAAERENSNGWARVVVEKPFGRDLPTALALERTLHNSFQEHQIFRIDHYLAKETVQNILMLRFANTIFEPLWNRGYIDYVGIVAAERLGVEHRAGYYEQSGVIRDMFQNHLMQLLALTAMEPPSLFEAHRVQDEKVKVFRSLKPFSIENMDENLILGQYGPGVAADDSRVAAYREEPGVAPDSLTPTFALMRVFIDNWRWRNVPFYLLSGKRLKRKITKVVVQFKKVPHMMFRNVLEENIIANRLVMGVFPREEITLAFQTKRPGPKACLRTVTMAFGYEQDFSGPALEAYEKVLLDCIQGDHMLFWRQDGVELSWSFLTPILQECESCRDMAKQLHAYESGGWGPVQARQWAQLILD